ncbi:hypothetical protein F3Y22_tig00110239pilonHSYRG00108 [Hibiscus syriacus]|uniref:HMG box domain-containing protein n=1 Tax=Hibiscus syriacus TaxID=106335 RepID=A0A6A3B6K2_HIBSY|nr:hypothetical protein F3Y22_tig00110239pilonHSYRG00108 [Hibiscus syriacus]
MKSKDLGIVGGKDDFEIEAEIRKQPNGGYIYFYMTEYQRMKESGKHIGSKRNDVLEKWNSMSDAEKEPYIAQSKMDSEEYKEWRKAHEKNEVSTRCNIKRVNSLIKHLKEDDQLNMLEEMGFGLLVGVRDQPIRRELCRSLIEQFDVEQCIAKYEKIKSGSYEGDELKARVLLYLVRIFLCPTGDTSKNKDYIKLICDEGLKGEFNWAEYVHLRLIESIITFKKGSQRYLKGCIAILEVALFNFWSGCEAVPAYERTGVIGKEAAEKEEEMVVLGMTVRGVEEILERHKGEVEGKIDGVMKEVEVLRGKVVKEVEVLKGELKMVTDIELDSECPVPQKKKQKVEKADIPSGIDQLEATICDYLWNSGLESDLSVISMGNQYASVSDVGTLKPTEWVGGVVIYLLTWIVCYDAKKSLQRTVYLSYHLAQQALKSNKKVTIEGIASFWGPILDNYMKFTDCEKIMITINYHNSHWYMLVLDMVERVATVYDSLFTSEAAKQIVNDAKNWYI